MRLRLAFLCTSLITVAACPSDPIVPTDATPDADLTDALDLDPPETTIDDGPDPLVNEDEATFTFSSDEPGTFLCRLDGGSQSPCTSPRMLTNLAEGGHTFEVTAVDTSERQDPSPALHMWRVDTIDPDTEITTAPPAIDNSTTAMIEFRAPGEVDATFECSLDGSVFAVCTTPYTTPVLTDGNHIFRVRSIDQAGNADSSTANANWLVDTISPDTTIDSGPAGVVNSRNATFTFSSPGFMPGFTFNCRLDNAAFALCTSPRNFSGLLDGPHSFEVRVTDDLGNDDPSPARRNWTVDSTGPVTSITIRPDNPSGDTTPTFEFTANEVATFECQIDGLIPYAPCASPSTTPALPAGIRFFRIRATDAVGNVGPEATYEWVIDASGPTVNITGGPNGPVASSTVTFNWNSSEPATYCHRFTGDAMDTCTMGIAGSGTVTRMNLMQGDQTFTVTATDALGNVGPPTVRNFSVDTVGPPVTISVGPMNTVGTVANLFTFTSTEPATFCHKVDTLGEVCTLTPALMSSVTINAIDGAHSLTVVARDVLGNRTAMPVVRMWTIDTVRPTTTITAGPDQGSTDGDGDAMVMLASTEASTICWRINGGMETCSMAGQMMFTADLMGMTDGVVNFSARSQDAIGFGPVVTRTWTVDSVRPTVMITAGPADASTLGSASATFTVTASEPSQICWQFNMDDEVCSPAGLLTFSPSKAGLPQGANTFTVRAKDAIDNGPSMMRSWTVDTIRPIVTINSGPLQGSTINNNVSMLMVNSSESSTICWRFNGGAETCSAAGVMTADVTSPPLGQGGNLFEVYGKDAVGTGATVQRSWTVDSTRPTITILTGPAQDSAQGSTNASFTVASSEPAKICWQFNGGAEVCTQVGQFTAVASTTIPLTEGAATFTVTGADAVGAGMQTLRGWTVDLTRPTISFTAGPMANAVLNATMTSFTATSTEAATICWRLDAGTETCSAAGQMMTNIGLMALPQGSHTVFVYGRDGVAAGPTLSRTFVVDTVRPVTTFTSGPAAGATVNNTSVSFGLASSEPAQICWKFNMAAEVCTMATNVLTATASANGLPQGMNTVAVRSIDADTGATVSRTFFVDTMAPTVMITAGPMQGSVQPVSNFTFTVAASESSLVCWRFNGAAQQQCAQTNGMNEVTFVSGPLPSGPNVLAVWAVDGNGAGMTVLRSWSNDTARPVVSITSGPTQNQAVDNANASFGISSNEPATICWSFDGDGPTCSAPGQMMVTATKNGLIDGPHVFTVSGADAVGAGPLVTRNWSIDTMPATITIGPPGQGTRSKVTNPMITITTNEPATICWKLDGVNPATCSAPGAMMLVANLAGLTEAAHTLDVTATDAVAHQSTLARVWTVDLTLPVITISTPPAEGGGSGPNVNFTLGTDEPSTICWVLDAMGAPTCSAPGVVVFNVALMNLPVGAHVLAVDATDEATNVRMATRNWTSAAAKPAAPDMTGPTQLYTGMISAWVRDTAKSDGQILVVSAAQGGCTLRGVGSLLGLECTRGGETLTGAYGMLGSVGKSDGEWHLVTVAFTGDTAELWIDGAFADRTGEGAGALVAGGAVVAKGSGAYAVESLTVR